MFGSHAALAAAAIHDSNSCAPIAVRMSGTAGTLAGRIANCTDAWVRNYGNWYDVIYVGNGFGWAMDRGAMGEKVQQHLCLLKGLNPGTTAERQIGDTRAHEPASATRRAYELTVGNNGRNMSDPGNKDRLRVVDNPYKPGSPCLLMRTRRTVDTGSTLRAALRVFGTGYNAAGQYDSTQSNRYMPSMRHMDRMPRLREQWFACAYIFGDDASFDQGESESWINAPAGTPEICGWQLHNDDMTGGNFAGASSPNDAQSLTPNFGLWLVPTTGSTESNCKLQIKRWRPAGPTKTDSSADYIAPSQSGADGAMESSASALLWESAVPFRTRWVGFVNRLIWSKGGDGVIQTWYNELNSYVSGAAPTEIINVTGRTDTGHGGLGVGAYGNATGRFNPQNRRGDPYLCFEIYNAHNVSALPASVTIRAMPIRFHDRNPARTIAEYSADLMSLLKAAVY